MQERIWLMSFRLVLPWRADELGSRASVKRCDAKAMSSKSNAKATATVMSSAKGSPVDLTS